MKPTPFGPIALLAAALVLVFAPEAWAWGSATHVKLASDVLAHLSLLPAAVAGIIAAHRRYFMYGNVATDTVLAKKMSKVKQICHRWDTGFKLLETSKTDEGRAFGYGYLAHLAADTVAHNKFLPRQMAVARSTVAFGHFYWEVRADAHVPKRHGRQLSRLVRAEYPEPEALLEEHLLSTMLSFRTNRLIFRQVNRLASERGWRRSVEFWSRLSRYDLDVRILNEYHEESVGRVVDVLRHGLASEVMHEDPNGNASLAYARAQRRQLRRLKRARIPHTQVIREAAAGHAPKPNRALALSID